MPSSGGRTPGSGLTDFTGTQPVPCRPEWAGQSDSQGASGHQGLCKVTSEVTSLCPGGRAWPGSRALPPLPASLCLGALGTEGLRGGQRGHGSDIRTAGPCVVPKISNPRNHQGADTDETPEGLFTSWSLVQVHQTHWSRDLDPETKGRGSFIGASGPWDTQKVAQSCRSTCGCPTE